MPRMHREPAARRGADEVGSAAEPLSLRHDRSFVLFLSSRTVSVAGYAVTAVALPLLVLQLTGSAFLTALVAAVEVVPYLVFGLVAGALADRVDRRRLMVGCHVIAALALATIPVASAAGVLTAGQVLTVALVTSTCFVWFDAASFGALPALVGRDRIVAANSAVFTSATLVELSFPVVAGILIATIGPALAIGVDAVSYCLAAVLLWWIPLGMQGAPRQKAEADGSPVRRVVKDIREGLTFLWHNDLVRSLSLYGFGNAVSGGAVTALLVVYGVRELGLSTSDWRLGTLFGAAALGGLSASLMLPRLVRAFPVGWISIGALTAHPVLLVAVAIAPSLAVALPLLVLWAGSWLLAIINGISARQLVTPDHLQGRVNTTARMIAWGGAPVGALIAGVIAQTSSVQTAYLVMPLAVAVSAALAWRSPLRRRDLVPSSAPAVPR